MQAAAGFMIGIAMLASSGSAHAVPFVGQSMTVTFGYCPLGWVEMDGRLMSIMENEILFQLIGTIYGGDGTDTFALPVASAEYANGILLRQCISLFGVFPND